MLHTGSLMTPDLLAEEPNPWPSNPPSDFIPFIPRELKTSASVGIIVGLIAVNPFICFGISKALSVSSIRLCMNCLMIFVIYKSILNSAEV